MSAPAIVWTDMAVIAKTNLIDLTHLGHGPDFTQPWRIMSLRAPRVAQAHDNNSIKEKKRK